MTTVYNVTFYGAKLQIKKQLEAAEFPREHLSAASIYIADATFSSIKKLFKSARSIQNWLSESAYLVSRVNNQTVRWQTPLGMTIAQPYFMKLGSETASQIKGRREIYDLDKPNFMKQRNAFPPK